jgi:hypothetical protein
MLEKFFKNVESVETAFCCYISVVYKFSIFHVFHTFEKKIRFMGVFDPVSTLSPLNFVKSTQKIFANVILCGFFDTLFHTFGLQKVWLFYDLATLLP